MVSASLTERLAAEAMALTREAYRPTVCCWFPACSMPGTSWRCGCVAKVGARSDQEAAEQQQRALVRGLVRGLVQVRAEQQQVSVPGASQGVVHAPATEAETPQLACIARCLKFSNHISHSCYFCSAYRYPSFATHFLCITTRVSVLSPCRFFNTIWLQATISRRIGTIVYNSPCWRMCMSCIIYQYKKPILYNPSTVSAWWLVLLTTGTIITRRLSVGTPTRLFSRLAYIDRATLLESMACLPVRYGPKTPISPVNYPHRGSLPS